MHPRSTPTRLPRWGPRWLRCSSLKYSRYSRSSRLAIGAPRPSRCDARLSPRAVNRRDRRERLSLRSLRAPRLGLRGLVGLFVLVASPVAAPADGADFFRTFVIPIPLSAARFVRALEFHPGNTRVVHHANLGVDRTRSSRQLDARDPEPGYTGSMERDARYPEGQLLGWTPGQAAHPVPDGTQWRLEPNSDLVVQLHLQPTGKPEAVQVTVGLFFTDTPPARTPIGLRLGSETIE